MSLRPALLRAAEVPRRQLSAWADLVSRAAEPNPFFEPDYVVPSVRHRKVPIVLLTVFEGDDMVACLPLFRHGRTLLRLPMWGVPNVLGVPHVDPACVDRAWPVALRFLATRFDVRRMLRLHRVPADGVVGPALLAAVDRFRCPTMEPGPVSCPTLRRRRDPTYLKERLQSRTRLKLGQKRRNFESLLGHRLRLVDRGTDPSAVERFLALEAAGWKGQAGTAMLGIPGESNFFREMCGRFRDRGRLRMLSLEAGGTTVAMRCDVAAGEGLFSLKTSYDERYARFSPGLLLEIDSVAMFHEGSAAWLSSATNYPDSPTFAVYPDRRTLVDAVAILDPVTRLLLTQLVRPALQWRRERFSNRAEKCSNPLGMESDV
jgi:CelD/BcsL family acetyltransferase involved in cellulose biosynthesis